MVVCPKDTREGKTTHRYFSQQFRHSPSVFRQKKRANQLGSTGERAPTRNRSFKLSCTQGGTEAQRPAARPARSRLQARCTVQGEIRSGTRFTKWARGSRSQTHRRAAMGGFTQDDGYVQGVAPMHWVDAPRIPFWTSSNFCDFSSSGRCVPKTYRYRYFANTV